MGEFPSSESSSRIGHVFREWRAGAANLRDAAAEGEPFEELVEGEGGDERPDGAGAQRHPQRQPDDDRMGDDPQLQDLIIQSPWINHPRSFAEEVLRC